MTKGHSEVQRRIDAPSENEGITVLLVDDQKHIAQGVKELLSGEKDIQFHYCGDPLKAISAADELSPTVILQDLVMPDLDGFTLARLFKSHHRLKDVPLIVLSSRDEAEVKAEAFSAGANDYLVKLPEKIELVARVRYHSKAYINLLQRNKAYADLSASRELLSSEISRAARYVASLLPLPVEEGNITASWRFFPSSTLGGDSFGYHWVDDECFAIYLLDASGHGVGAALLSVSALNMIRSQSLPGTDFTNPSEVLNSLNRSFPMERHDNLYFTLWYGVYNTRTGLLSYAGAGHPPPLLIQERGKESVLLSTRNSFIGYEKDVPYRSSDVMIRFPATLYIFSDGVYEIVGKDGALWTFAELTAYLKDPPRDGRDEMDALYLSVLEKSGGETLEDDFSLIRIGFTERD